jgi:MFS family permease
VILALVCAAQFMLILDLVVVNVALPTMQKDLRLSPSDLQWVVIIYGLAFGGFLLLGGRAADLLGRRNVLVAGLTMFTAGSLAAGLAGSLAPLAGLVMGSFFGIGFQSTLFLQQVLGYSPLRTGAAGVITAVSSIIVASAIAARVVGRLGAARTLVIGQGIAVAGLLYLSRASVHAGYWSDLFPAFLASGIGIGLSGVAVQVAAFIGVKDKVSGLAGGMVSTAQEVGAALGLAIIATAALARQRSRMPPGARRPSAVSPRPQASSAARWWPPDSALVPRSPPGSCSGEPNGPRPRLACRNQRPNPR